MPLHKPSGGGILKYRYLLQELIRKNIMLQYRNSVLGVLWTFLQPLFTMIILVLIFGGIFGKDEVLVLNYPTYLLCGRLLFEFYSQATKKSMRSVLSNASVIKKVYVPKMIYPLSSVISTFVTFMISLAVLGLVMAYMMLFTDTAMRITPFILLAAVPVAILFMLALGVGMVLAVMQVFFRDTEYLYDVFCTLLFYATPVFYVVEQLNLPKTVEILMRLNPLCSLITMFRDCVLFGRMFSAADFLYSLLFSAFFLALGWLIFKKNQNKFILHI